MKKYSFDLIDGEQVPPLVLNGDSFLDSHQGTVHVESGTFNLAGTLSGTLDIQAGVRATISGRQRGTVSVERHATVVVRGRIEGTVSVQPFGLVIVEQGARLAGTLSNDGLVVVRGMFGGAQTGAGELRLEGEGAIIEPTIEEGIQIYKWSD